MRQGGACKCVPGWPRALPPFSLPSLLLIILSVNLSSCPDTTLTPTPFSFCVCAVGRRTVLIMRENASLERYHVCLQCMIHPLITCPGFVCGKTLTPTAFTHQDSTIRNQGHWHLGEFNSFQPPCSLNSRS